MLIREEKAAIVTSLSHVQRCRAAACVAFPLRQVTHLDAEPFNLSQRLRGGAR